MLELFSRLWDFFFGSNLVEAFSLLWLLPVLLFYAWGSLQLAYFFKSKKSWKVGYTRKLFHFLIFAMAAFMQYRYGTGGVFVLGWAVTIMIAYILILNRKSKFYTLLARPQDEPHPSRYIVYPYLATFLGGVVNHLFFNSVAIVSAYLVTGLGDAIGEPVGTKWGRHKYPVFNLWSQVKSYRTLEGSLSVFLASVLSLYLAWNLYSVEYSVIYIILTASVVTLVEAISPHGWDNFTLQVSTACWVQYAIF